MPTSVALMPSLAVCPPVVRSLSKSRTAHRGRLWPVVPNVKLIDLTLRSGVCPPWLWYAGLLRRGSTYLNQIRGYPVGYAEDRIELTKSARCCAYNPVLAISLVLPIRHALRSDDPDIGGILNAATRMIDPPGNVNFALKTRIRRGHFLIVGNAAVTIEKIAGGIAIRDE